MGGVNWTRHVQIALIAPKWLHTMNLHVHVAIEGAEKPSLVYSRPSTDKTIITQKHAR